MNDSDSVFPISPNDAILTQWIANLTHYYMDAANYTEGFKLFTKNIYEPPTANPQCALCCHFIMSEPDQSIFDHFDSDKKHCQDSIEIS